MLAEEQVLSVPDVSTRMKGRSSIIKSTTTGQPTTELDPVLGGLPWQDTFNLGSGIDAVTGNTMHSALVPFTPTQRTVKRSWESIRFVKNESDLKREIEVSASGKYNIQGVTVSASASYLNSIQFSELTTSLVAQYESQYNGYDETDNYILTGAAQALLPNPPQFRSMYGDYFIAGGKRSSRFTAVYLCKATSASSMDKFMASFGGSAPEVFSAEGSTKFMQAASSANISIAVDIVMEGYAGVPPYGPPWTPENLLQALNWFKENEQGVYLEAKFKHYSAFDPNYPRSIDIAPNVFVELRQLYTAVWEVRSRYASCPPVYQDGQLKKDYINLDAGVQANQNVLATNDDLRLEYQQAAESLRTQLNDIFARMDFYFKVQGAVATEPPKGQSIEEGVGQQVWTYGFSKSPNPAVVISSQEENYQQSPHVGWRENTFQFGPNQSILLVGWEVISNRHDGMNGSWKKFVDQILLGDYAAIYVISLYDRGCDWSVRFYYVNATDYQFSDALLKRQPVAH